MSISVLQPTSVDPDCEEPTEAEPTCLDPISNTPTCLEPLEPELGFFLSTEPDVQIFELDFGTVLVGETSVLTVIIRNIGTFVLSLCDYLIEGDGFSFFVIPGTTQLEPGEETTVQIQFAPTE